MPSAAVLYLQAQHDGSIYGAAKLRDIRVSDPEGVFLTVPEAELDWRPLAWLRTGLDVRLLALHRGVLRRAPRLRPSEDKNAPILPDFDIRIDKLVIDNLTVSEAMAGQKRRVDVLAKADIRGGHAIVDVAGKIAGDRVLFRLDSEPDRDKFDLRLAYNSPKDGMITKMAGADGDIRQLGHCLLGGLPVGGEVVHPTEQEVIDPRCRRNVPAGR